MQSRPPLREVDVANLTSTSCHTAGELTVVKEGNVTQFIMMCDGAHTHLIAKGPRLDVPERVIGAPTAFKFTGDTQFYDVPSTAKKVKITAWGAAGGTG